MKRWHLAAGLLCLLVAATAASCKPIPETDTATPEVYMLAFANNGSGGQGAQEHIKPGGTYTVNRTFLGPQLANIRVYGSEDPGITNLVVSGSARGSCSTKIAPNGQVFTAPGALSASFPDQSANAPAGQIQSFLTVDLDGLLAGEYSCGVHRYANMPERMEFFLDSGTWTIHAEANNCCGGKAAGDFTVVVR